MSSPLNRTRRTSLKLLSLALASGGLLAACGGGDDDNLDDRLDIADPKLRFVHAAPGAQAVSLVRNNVPEANVTAAPYKFGSQYYVVGTDTTNLSLRVASNNAEIATTSFPARRGNRYTTIALPAATTSGVELVTIDDPYNRSVTTDNAYLRFVNASANAPSVDIYVTAPGVDLATVSPTFPALGFKQIAPATTNGSRSFTAGTYQVRATTAGTKTVVYASAAIAVPKNADWLFLTLPEDATPTTPNSIRLLVVRADDSADATDEYLNVP
jgi:Domain of unknown function (DUF4397)